MKNKIFKSLIVSSLVLCNYVSAADCRDVSQVIAKQLEDNYVIENTATTLAQLMRSQAFLSGCERQKSSEDIADFITLELNKIANDKHLSVVYDPNWVSELKAYRSSAQTEAFAGSREMETPTDNYGFKKVEMLDGNIGYLDIRVFSDSHLGGETLENSMKFLQHSDGIIIDLRNNFGGSPFMVTSLASYFFDLDTVHLLTFESRTNGVLTQTQDWTSPYVPGPRFKDTPLYILTSNNSASAAESFSYVMKNLARATIIGEVTAGAAHARSAEIVNENYILTLPSSRPIDPRTNGNWERKGVKPNIETSSDNAFYLAYAEVLNTLIKSKHRNLGIHQWVYPLVKAKSNKYQPSQNDIDQIIGTYGKRKIFKENGKLFYQNLDEPAFEIELLDKETIVFKAFTEARLQAIYKDKQAIALKMLSFGEEARKFQRTM
ncbi:S41 family peptidase [Shewanella sp. Scap07]|uniref:S41 family peptidase n=1 Tax=Shewanella sp. Scap07 TaxID=2589987 RepID=UPI0015B8D744|nr:S41 family peptidase [Shewanella sp. Scap07]QLE85354.1 S41 family peptidase [Shewanella sp. Scap07]